MATCPNGHANPDGQRFCGECGEPIEPTEPAAAEPASTKAAGEDEHPSQDWHKPPQRSKVNTRPFWITVGAILALTILIGVIAGVVGGNDDKDTSEDVLTEPEPTADYDYTPPVPSATVPPITSPPTVFTPPPPPSPPPPPPSVTYDLTGQGSVFVTMQNASGGTEQFETRLPYHLDLGPAGTFGGLSGFVYISAQLQDTGTVTCTIKKGEQVIQTATSTGQYVIASCSGSV
jgi:hypothetical protein